MNKIKILHLLPHLLSLYGEYGNVAILEKTLKDAGFEISVTQWNGGSLELEDFHFIYIGSGTEDNLLEAVKRLLPHQETIQASIESGALWLATGNAMAVFGKSIDYKNAVSDALSVLPYATVIDPTRYLGDVLTADAFGQPMIGYVNTSCRYQGIDQPLLKFRLGKELGNTKSSPADGIRHRNFYGTQLIGPVLVKNPHFLAHMVQEITGKEHGFSPDSNIRKAYDISRTELEKRL